MQKDGIDVSGIRFVDGMATGTAVIVVVDGDNRIILDKGANACLSRSDIDEGLKGASAGDIYLTQLENPIDVIGYGLQKAKEKGLFVILNPAPANLEILPYLKYCDLVIPNETEMEILGGIEHLKEQGCMLIETLGSKGYRIVQGKDSTDYPCMKVVAVDTTAAGDTFCGGLCARLAQGASLAESASYGSKAASIACTRQGAQTSIPTAKELEKY
jgi:ribokinase